MARDTQIVSSADHEAPKDYVIPGNAELVLRAVQATFTDNGASGDWLPCVTLVSDSGHVIARASDQGVKVTAGTDASVSWFPEVGGHAQQAVGGAAAYAELRRSDHDFGDPFWTVPAGNSNLVPFPHQTISDATVFQMGTVTNPDDELRLLKSGLYLFQAWTRWELADFIRYAILDTQTPVVVAPPNTPANAFSISNPFGIGPTWTYDSQGGFSSASGSQSLRCFNGGGADHDVEEAGLMAYYWPTT